MLRNSPLYFLKAALLRDIKEYFWSYGIDKPTLRRQYLASLMSGLCPEFTPSFAKACSFCREIWGVSTVWIDVIDGRIVSGNVRIGGE